MAVVDRAPTVGRPLPGAVHTTRLRRRRVPRLTGAALKAQPGAATAFEPETA